MNTRYTRSQPPTIPGTLAGCRVLIASAYYAPETTGNAPYVAGLAEHLAALGARVRVLTTMPHYPQWRIWEQYRGRWRVRENRHGVQVRRFRHYVPARQSAVQRALYEGSLLGHALPFTGGGQPDVVLGVVPSLSGGVLAAAAARRHDVSYGLIFQDLVGRAAVQSGIAGGGRVARLTAAVEGRIARGAAGVAVVAEGFRPYLHEAGVSPDRITLLPNWTHIARPHQARERTRAELGWASDCQVVLHAGNMGLKQGLEHVVQAARLAAEERSRVRFVLMGDGNQRSSLETLATGLPTVSFMDPQPAERFPDILAAADVLLVNERKSVVDMALPSKLTSYMVAGRPILAAVTAGGATAREVARSGAGLVVAAEEPRALLSALERLAAEPDLANRLAAAGASYAEHELGAAANLRRAEEFIRSLLGWSRPAQRAVAGQEIP